MAKHVEGTFENKGWDENTTAEFDGSKISRASVEQTFAGALSGDARIEWQMYYAPDGTASFVGLQRMDAQLDDRSGTIVVQTTGVFDGKEAKGDWVVVGATGGLEGLSGTGAFSAPMGPSGKYSLDYDL
ncbi:MAG: DUF3224 domain-containing protein [Acidimicrobiia bacterium]